MSYFLMFSLRSFIISGLMFKSWIWLNLCEWYKTEVQLHSSKWVSIAFLKILFFPSLNCLAVVVDQLLSHVRLSETPGTAVHQASLSFTISWNLLKLMSIESVMPSNHLILCHPFLLLPSIFPSIRVFSNESALHIRWPKYWSFSFSISPSSEYSGLISLRID